ncbi:MAG: hypothetical protein ABIB47_01605 [Candidatus Woesearchaeota archaeon]
MTVLNQYSKGVLKSWRTGRLGCLYMNSFIASREHSDELGQLELVTEILALRPFEKRLELYHEIKRHHDNSVRWEAYEHAQILKDMQNHCGRFILD